MIGGDSQRCQFNGLRFVDLEDCPPQPLWLWRECRAAGPRLSAEQDKMVSATGSAPGP